MNKTLQFLKDKFVSDDNAKIKIYNILIWSLILFIICYSSYFITSSVHSSQSLKPQFVSSQQSIQDPNYNPSISNTTNMIPPTIIYTNGTLPSTEFYVGEVVGIKYFGVFGIVIDKNLGVNGYIYQVRWKDNSRDLPKDVFYSWELYRPKEGSVPQSAIEN